MCVSVQQFMEGFFSFFTDIYSLFLALTNYWKRPKFSNKQIYKPLTLMAHFFFFNCRLVALFESGLM